MSLRPIALLAFLLATSFFGHAHAQSCITDHDCQDGIWCNGVERCVGNPGRNQCQPAARPMCSAKKRCDESAQRCVSQAQAQKQKEHVCPQGEAYSVVEDKCVATPAPLGGLGG